MSKGRPKKPRTILTEPKIRQFSPRGRIGRPGHIALKFEEFEAIRLYDYIGLTQKEAARFMRISQQTFSRILKNARRRLAEALIKGKIIMINGGDFRLEG